MGMFSLVIPTHNRAPILRRSLAHLLQLEGISDCEVIVVNDGSTDQTAAVLDEFRQAFPKILRPVEVTNGGPGHARNAGVQAATKERILFIDDDVFPRPGMMQKHWRLLDQGYTGSQGILLWHSDINITPLIQYIDSQGTQFAFDRVKDPNHLDFTYVYTASFAIAKRAVVETGGFDTRFFNKSHGFSAFEDTIFAYKLTQNGARLALNREALADHLHDMTEDGLLRREYKVGYATGRLQQEYPQIAQFLDLHRKDQFVPSQVWLMHLINSTGLLQPIFGYPLAMRLRHREAFYRGLLFFKQELARKGTTACTCI